MKTIDLQTAPQHITQLAIWHHKEWAHLNPGRSVEHLIAQMHDYLGDASIPKMFICEQDGQVLGSSALIKFDMDTHREWSPWLANVYVSSDHRKKGLGSTLVKAVLDYARKQELKKIYLFTPDQEEFYQALGWSTIAKEIYKNEMVTIMQYDFSG